MIWVKVIFMTNSYSVLKLRLYSFKIQSTSYFRSCTSFAQDKSKQQDTPFLIFSPLFLIVLVTNECIRYITKSDKYVYFHSSHPRNQKHDMPDNDLFDIIKTYGKQWFCFAVWPLNNFLNDSFNG